MDSIYSSHPYIPRDHSSDQKCAKANGLARENRNGALAMPKGRRLKTHFPLFCAPGTAIFADGTKCPSTNLTNLRTTDDTRNLDDGIVLRHMQAWPQPSPAQPALTTRTPPSSPERRAAWSLAPMLLLSVRVTIKRPRATCAQTPIYGKQSVQVLRVHPSRCDRTQSLSAFVPAGCVRALAAIAVLVQGASGCLQL